ncbi:transposase [Cupriavidus sp. LEh25]|uniref:transposase n=1 Tax=Cupriavidus consociatus TaxID=2821357 RepID=UPI001AEAD0C4|nr:transposase [Cupriavidus sp. LEh25]
MYKSILDDDLWAMIQPLLPAPKPRLPGCPGRNRLGDRAALSGIIFVLQTGIRWAKLPQEMGCGSGMSCWRRLRAWQEAGIWDKLSEVLVANVCEADNIDWSRATVRSSSLRRVEPLEQQDPTSLIEVDHVQSTNS